MSDSKNRTIEPPPYLRGRIPSPDRLLDCFVNEPPNVDRGALLYRAAYVPESVLPHRAQRVYRFGPPPELTESGDQMPFWWLYTAHAAETAIWEAQFCKNDVTRAGTFYFDDFAVQHGIIAELQFPRPLRFWNLDGSVSSRLGIYDDLSSPDYDWCQWFGYFMDVAMQSVDDATTRPDGFVYPSRRHRGHTAIAISSRVLPELRDGVVRTETPFSQHPDFERLRGDRLRVAPPAVDASADEPSAP
jgi:RES domain